MNHIKIEVDNIKINWIVTVNLIWNVKQHVIDQIYFYRSRFWFTSWVLFIFEYWIEVDHNYCGYRTIINVVSKRHCSVSYLDGNLNSATSVHFITHVSIEHQALVPSFGNKIGTLVNNVAVRGMLNLFYSAFTTFTTENITHVLSSWKDHVHL